jgi:hypothetical protein
VLERTVSMTNDFLEPITFILSYPTVFHSLHFHTLHASSITPNKHTHIIYYISIPCFDISHTIFRGNLRLPRKEQINSPPEVGVRYTETSDEPRNFSGGVYARNCFRVGSKNSVDDRGQRERGSEGSSPRVKGSAQSANA